MKVCSLNASTQQNQVFFLKKEPLVCQRESTHDPLPVKQVNKPIGYPKALGCQRNLHLQTVFTTGWAANACIAELFLIKKKENMTKRRKCCYGSSTCAKDQKLKITMETLAHDSTLVHLKIFHPP